MFSCCTDTTSAIQPNQAPHPTTVAWQAPDSTLEPLPNDTWSNETTSAINSLHEEPEPDDLAPPAASGAPAAATLDTITLTLPPQRAADQPLTLTPYYIFIKAYLSFLTLFESGRHVQHELANFSLTPEEERLVIPPSFSLAAAALAPTLTALDTSGIAPPPPSPALQTGVLPPPLTPAFSTITSGKKWKYTLTNFHSESPGSLSGQQLSTQHPVDFDERGERAYLPRDTSDKAQLGEGAFGVTYLLSDNTLVKKYMQLYHFSTYRKTQAPGSCIAESDFLAGPESPRAQRGEQGSYKTTIKEFICFWVAYPPSDTIDPASITCTIELEEYPTYLSVAHIKLPHFTGMRWHDYIFQNIQSTPLSVLPMIVQSLLAICQELKRIHDLGIIHGDIHGANIIGGDDKWRFIDFGFAYFIEENKLTIQYDIGKLAEMIAKLAHQFFNMHRRQRDPVRAHFLEYYRYLQNLARWVNIQHNLTPIIAYLRSALCPSERFSPASTK